MCWIVLGLYEFVLKKSWNLKCTCDVLFIFSPLYLLKSSCSRMDIFFHVLTCIGPDYTFPNWTPPLKNSVSGEKNMIYSKFCSEFWEWIIFIRSLTFPVWKKNWRTNSYFARKQNIALDSCVILKTRKKFDVLWNAIKYWS